MSEETHSVRLDQVEAEVGAIRSEMGGLKTEMGRVQVDVKGLGAILSRIEQSVVRAQDQQDQRDASSRHSPVAIATVLVTVMSLMVGGAWLIGSNIARMDERSAWVQQEQARTDERVWEIATHKGDGHGQSGQAPQ